MGFISITHLRLGGTHSSSSKQIFVSRCCRRTSRRQSRARDLGTADVANVDNYIKYIHNQTDSNSWAQISFYGATASPTRQKKRKQTLYKGWWVDLPPETKSLLIPIMSPGPIGPAIWWYFVCWGSIPSKHSNGNHPDNPRHVDDAPCTKNFEHFALPAMLRQSSWDSEVGLPKTNAGARNKNKAVGISLVIVNKHENGTTRSRMCVYFKQARTNLEVDAPLICSITIFWWKRVLYWKKRGQRCCWWNITVQVSVKDPLYFADLPRPLWSLPFGFPADCFHLCIPTSGVGKINRARAALWVPHWTFKELNIASSPHPTFL